MTDRVARGSLSGRWSPRGDGAPNLTGAVTIERDLPKGTKLWLGAWSRSAAGCDEFLSVVVKIANGGPRKGVRSRNRRATETAEPEGVFRDRVPP
jgi:hypothetical protein